MMTTEAPPISDLNPLESSRQRIGLARLQLLRLIDAGPRYVLFAMPSGYFEADPAGIEYLRRAYAIERDFAEFVSDIEAQLAPPAFVDIWGLAELLDVSPWQITRWRAADLVRASASEERGQNRAPTALYNLDDLKALVATHTDIVQRGIMRSGPLAPAFLRWLKRKRAQQHDSDHASSAYQIDPKRDPALENAQGTDDTTHANFN